MIVKKKSSYFLKFKSQELAGRTMDFTFDVAQTPLIGRRILLKSETGSTQNINRNNGQAVHLNHNISGTPNSPRRSASLSPADTAPLSGWKRPWLSQSRVRECLVNLLTTCGQRAVGLPKSPSVCDKSIAQLDCLSITTKPKKKYQSIFARIYI